MLYNVNLVRYITSYIHHLVTLHYTPREKRALSSGPSVKVAVVHNT